MGRISSGGMMFKAITTVAALVIATSAMAQDDLTISSLAKGETTKAAFNQMVQGHKLPAWVMKGGTYTPAQTVTLGDETYQVMSACKPHDCAIRTSIMSAVLLLITIWILQMMSFIWQTLGSNRFPLSR